MTNAADNEDLPDVSGYLSTGAVAKRFGVAGRTVRRWCETGLIRSWRSVSGRTYIPEQEVTRVLREGIRSPRPPVTPADLAALPGGAVSCQTTSGGHHFDHYDIDEFELHPAGEAGDSE